MKKLSLLKAIIDYIWIITCIPLSIILPFFCIYMFIDSSVLSFVFSNNIIGTKTSILSLQYFSIGVILTIFTALYCFYLFRKTLVYFKNAMPFHTSVIYNFNIIGQLLIAVSLVSIMLLILFVVVLHQEFNFVTNLGIIPYLVLLSLGLFFMILSQVFKMAKHTKQENDLTI